MHIFWLITSILILYLKIISKAVITDIRMKPVLVIFYVSNEIYDNNLIPITIVLKHMNKFFSHS